MWESFAKVMLPDLKKRKLGSHTFDSVFVSYAQNSIVYRFLVV